MSETRRAHAPSSAHAPFPRSRPCPTTPTCLMIAFSRSVLVTTAKVRVAGMATYSANLKTWKKKWERGDGAAPIW